MKTICYILFCLVCLSSVKTEAQGSVKDSAFRIMMVSVHFSGQIPQKDMAKRYGPNLSAGGSYTWKTKHNVLFGTEVSYFFGRNIKEDPLKSLRVGDGSQVTDNEGYPADLRLTERGWNVYANAGYLFSKLGHNPNSGVFFTVGAGWMQHKIKFYDANKKVAAVYGNLKKGYDRLSGGFALSQYIGYQYLSNNRLANFNFGIEFYEGFTKSLRGFNYDTGLADTKQRLDIMMGFRIAWTLPLYKRLKDVYYY
ncbi:MAG: hypothetical protein V4506_10970 [Bacteroidota bacterium]